MKNIKIKKATVKDLDNILELSKLMMEFYHKIDPYYTIYSKYEDHREFYEGQLKKKNVRFVLAKNEDGEAVGFGQASIVSMPKTRAPKIGHLTSVFVKKEYRSKGVGKEIFKDIMNWFKKENVKYVELHVDARNKAGLNMWKKLGFKDYQINLKMEL